MSPSIPLNTTCSGSIQHTAVHVQKPAALVVKDEVANLCHSQRGQCWSGRGRGFTAAVVRWCLRLSLRTGSQPTFFACPGGTSQLPHPVLTSTDHAANGTG